MNKTVSVKITNDNSTVDVPVGGNLWDALVAAGAMSPVGCGHRGLCDLCEVNVESDHKSYPVVSCQFTVTTPMTITIPERNRSRRKAKSA